MWCNNNIIIREVNVKWNRKDILNGSIRWESYRVGYRYNAVQYTTLQWRQQNIFWITNDAHSSPGRAIGCLLWGLWRKLTASWRHRTVYAYEHVNSISTNSSHRSGPLWPMGAWRDLTENLLYDTLARHYDHVECDTEWPPSCRRHFQMNCLLWKLLCFNSNFTEMLPRIQFTVSELLNSY